MFFLAGCMDGWLRDNSPCPPSSSTVPLTSNHPSLVLAAPNPTQPGFMIFRRPILVNIPGDSQTCPWQLSKMDGTGSRWTTPVGHALLSHVSGSHSLTDMSIHSS